MEEHSVHLHIGKRKLKSLLAIFLGFCLWQLIRIPFPALEVHPLFIYFYGLIEIRDSSRKTVDMGKLRIRCTLVGLAIGLVFVGIKDLLSIVANFGDLEIAAEMVLLLIGTLITLLVAEASHCKEFCGMAALVFIIMIVSYTNGEQYLYAILRALQTILGVGVAWYVNVVLFPYNGEKKA